MSWIAGLLNQDIVIWRPGALDAGGNTAWVTAADLTGRWQEKGELFLDANGERQLSKAVAYFDGGTDIPIDSRLFLGEAADLDSNQLSDPSTVTAAARVVQVDDSPGVDAVDSLIKVFLK